MLYQTITFKKEKDVFSSLKIADNENFSAEYDEDAEFSKEELLKTLEKYL